MNTLFTEHIISFNYISVLSSNLDLSLSNGVFLSGFPTKILYVFLLSAMSSACPSIAANFI